METLNYFAIIELNFFISLDFFLLPVLGFKIFFCTALSMALIVCWINSLAVSDFASIALRDFFIKLSKWLLTAVLCACNFLLFLKALAAALMLGIIFNLSLRSRSTAGEAIPRLPLNALNFY